jgi:hypothetical protein
MRRTLLASALLISRLIACSSAQTAAPSAAAGASLANAGSESSGGSSSGTAGVSEQAGAASTFDAGVGGATALGDAGASGADGKAGATLESDCADLLGGNGPVSAWVSASASGALSYKPLDAQGDRILDFSYAGYLGGGVALPKAPVVSTLQPSGGDDTAAIQAALDALSKRPLSQGLRGALLLSVGKFELLGTLKIAASGVVLRGSGSGAGGTELDLSGAPHELLTINGTGSWKTSGTVSVTDAYVPSGANTLTVSDASAFHVGDSVLIDRPVTAAWVHFMGMDTLVRDGAAQTWLAVGTLVHADRTVLAVAGNKLTFDAPLSDSYDAKYLKPPGATVSKYTFAGRISQVGVEALSIVAPASATPITQPQYQAIDLDVAQDCWLSDLTLRETVNSIHLGPASKRITVQDIAFSRTLPADGSAGYPLEITLEGTQNFVQRVSMKGDNIYTYATGGRVSGPNVYLFATGSGVHNRAEPHQRWATGLLADNASGEQINFYNRGTAGSGHGWAIGWGVVWNGEATSIDVEQPPGSQNFAIGCVGKQTASTVPGATDSPGKHVAPKSLYLAQLCLRLGRAAVSAIGD